MVMVREYASQAARSLEANPSIYFGLSIGVTFPINILFGIPVYSSIARILVS
jgi:hypothetical protein